MSKRLTIAQAQQQRPNLPQELINEPIIITQDGVPVMAAMSYTHLTELLETLDILTDTEFVAKLRQSITQDVVDGGFNRPVLSGFPYSALTAKPETTGAIAFNFKTGCSPSTC
ncbi:hypothetical protein [Microcoleus sp. LEGE 07076]|uniref:hypothetical protein n=1 Tax=Microcoleus sp. LEGE 07076 TaxID=915322 RepID=UPI001D145B03|nr:hypothetical protein [Microcoleus sp. LEGE 07076]